MAPALRMTRSIKEKLPIFGPFCSFSSLFYPIEVGSNPGGVGLDFFSKTAKRGCSV